MATTAPDTIERVNYGPVEVGEAELDGYSVSFLHVIGEVDMTAMLRGLPGDVCPCPHWGVVTDGEMRSGTPTTRRSSAPATSSTCRRTTCRCTSPARG